MLQTFTRVGNLHRWLNRHDSLPAIIACRQLFDKIFKRYHFECPLLMEPRGPIQDLPADLSSLPKVFSGTLQACIKLTM